MFYVYRITFLDENKHYIGSRTTNKMFSEDPLEDLKIYKTSSKIVNQKLQNMSDNNVKLKIVKISNNKNDILNFENSYIKRVSAVTSNKFYNFSAGSIINSKIISNTQKDTFRCKIFGYKNIIKLKNIYKWDPFLYEPTQTHVFKITFNDNKTVIFTNIRNLNLYFRNILKTWTPNINSICKNPEYPKYDKLNIKNIEKIKINSNTLNFVLENYDIVYNNYHTKEEIDDIVEYIDYLNCRLNAKGAASRKCNGYKHNIKTKQKMSKNGNKNKIAVNDGYNLFYVNEDELSTLLISGCKIGNLSKNKEKKYKMYWYYDPITKNTWRGPHHKAPVGYIRGRPKTGTFIGFEKVNKNRNGAHNKNKIGITNGTINSYINKTEKIPDGWYVGWTIKKKG